MGLGVTKSGDAEVTPKVTPINHRIALDHNTTHGTLNQYLSIVNKGLEDSIGLYWK
jgi:hypothetical protein